MSSVTTDPKRLEVEVTADQRKVITDAARREHQSVSGFMVEAALKAAESGRRPKRSQAEIDRIIREAQEAMRRANPTGRSIVDELTAERRAAAALE